MMIRRLRHIITVVACALAAGLSAQTDVQMSQYLELQSLYNPAAAGSTDMLRMRGGSRLQWVGIENAPKTFLFTADTPWRLGDRKFGAGVTVQYESLGLYRNTGVSLQLAYKFKISKGLLSVALQAGAMSNLFKGSEVYIPSGDDYHEPTDEGIPMTDMSGSAFDLGAGIYYSTAHFYAGLSCTHLNDPVVRFSTDTNTGTPDETIYEFRARRTVYFTVGGNIPVKNTLFEVIPSVLLKSDFTFTRAEATARIRYRRFLSAGIGYRHDDAAVFLLGVDFKGVYVGYSYDYPTSVLSKVSNGSHELVAGYSLKLDLSDKNRHRHKSIRIM